MSKNNREEFGKFLKTLEGKAHFHEEVNIKVLGLFDTVASLGFPKIAWSKLSNYFSNSEKYKYHDTSFPIPSRE
jgi:hypothetical protein